MVDHLYIIPSTEGGRCELILISDPKWCLPGNKSFSSLNWIQEDEILISSSALLRTFLFMLVSSFRRFMVLVLKDAKSHPFLCR